MAITVLDAMRARYRSLISTIGLLEKKIDSFPGGHIYIRTHRGYACYYWYYNKKDKYLGKNDTELIRQLAEKEHVTKALETALQEAEILKKDIIEYPKNHVENIYDSLPDAIRKYATPLITSDEEYARQWLSKPFTPKPFTKGAPEFYTLKGERVRSKSEVIIADRLFAKGIPYKYECPVLIGNEIIHPDLTILRLSDRKILYHEHCGKMGDPDYVEGMVSRVNKYAGDGIFLGDRLFLTFESADQPLDISWLDDFIEKNYR